jgi:hypothetical protein
MDVRIVSLFIAPLSCHEPFAHSLYISLSSLFSLILREREK